jgi:hypothetical protein
VAWQQSLSANAELSARAEWFSEEKTVSELFVDMLDWYDEIGVWR